MMLICIAATHLWKDTPQEFDVDHLYIVPAGTNYISIDANTDGARVTLNHYHNTLIVSKLTGSDGTATFDLSDAAMDDVTVTITKQDYIPYQNTFTISDEVDAINIDFDACSDCSSTIHNCIETCGYHRHGGIYSRNGNYCVCHEPY